MDPWLIGVEILIFVILGYSAYRSKNFSVLLVWTLIFIGILVVLHFQRQESAQNLFSDSCPPGQYRVDGVCEPPRACTTDDDCNYLLIERLPTRMGYCQNSICHAQCGSGVLRECV